MIPVSIPNLCGNEARYLQECIDTGFVSSVGPFVDRFEAMLATAAGTEKAVATSSGTTGLHLALATLGVSRDDLVILPSLTFIASANAISHCGATPWLFDVSPESWALDPGLLDRTLREETTLRDGKCLHRATGRRVAAIMPVHALGHSADMDPITRIAHTHGLAVVADGAAALGASYKGRPIGRTGADLTVFSFNGNKTVTCGGGGAIVGENPEQLALARHLSTTARVGASYDHDRVGFNYRMTNLTAAVGCAQLESLGAFITAKGAIRRRYDKAFSNLPGVGVFPEPAWGESAFWLSGLVLPEGGPDAFRASDLLRRDGIEARPFWKPMHLQEPYRQAPRTQQDVCERLWRRVLTLPCSTQLSAAEADKVIAAVTEILTHVRVS
jgi:dTDP-4-amino-4,6-dideoxygalactose transaminase